MVRRWPPCLSTSVHPAQASGGGKSSLIPAPPVPAATFGSRVWAPGTARTLTQAAADLTAAADYAPGAKDAARLRRIAARLTEAAEALEEEGYGVSLSGEAELAREASARGVVAEVELQCC